MSSRMDWHDFSVAEKTGVGAFLLALLLGYFTILQAAAAPLTLFLLACLCAPFLPRWSFFLPVISKGKQGAKGIALTFDDGPFPASTPVLLKLLAKYKLPATFFVVGTNAAAHPELIAAILAQGHTIGNHSYRHDNLLMLRNCRTLREDIQATQDILGRAGIRPLIFRPPVGVTSPRLKPVLASLGLQTITFSCRIFDRGNREVRNLAAKVLKQLRPGDILLLHDNPPRDDAMNAYWHQELECLFSTLHQLYPVVPLAILIDQPVVMPLQEQE
jgi:peptidoglycan/xylan/chitin deacetylase (PgdA/CDA1 family)